MNKLLVQKGSREPKKFDYFNTENLPSVEFSELYWPNWLNRDVEKKRTSCPAVWRPGAFGLDTQSQQEGGEFDVSDEAEPCEVTGRQVVCTGETV